MNINLLNHEDPKTKHQVKFIKQMKLTQLVAKPTRVTDRSQTLIDHTLTNRLELYNTSGVVEVGISDHAVVFAVRKKAKPKIQSSTFRPCLIVIMIVSHIIEM